MIKCEYCGKEIGLLAIRYKWLDKENKIAIHDKCIEEYEKKKPVESLEPKEKPEQQEKQKSEEKQEQKDSRMYAFSGIGSLIGIIIGGINFGIVGAMVGGVLGTILVSVGIEEHIRKLKTKGKFNPSTSALVVSYILAIIFTIVMIEQVAPFIVKNLLTSENVEPGLAGLLVQYLGPAFAGGIGALIPIWLSKGRKTE